MKRAALAVVAVGILLATAAPSMAHDHWGCAPAYHHHHGYYYGAVAPVVVAPAPVYGYANYPPVVSPAVPTVVAPVAPAPYYYGAPGVSFGYRGRGVAVGVHF